MRIEYQNDLCIHYPLFMHSSGIFTELYKAPEIGLLKTEGQQMGGRDYIKSDAFAAGIVVHDLLTNGKHAFLGKSNPETLMNMMKCDRTALQASPVDEFARNLIWSLTHKDPNKRITMEEALQSPFFFDDSTHIQFINVLNEYLIQMDDSKPHTKAIKSELNTTFFMLFLEPWKKLDFVLEKMLKRSKYTNSVVCFLRHNRNLLLHAAQHQELLVESFGKAHSDVELLQLILKSVPPFLIHLYWFAKRYLPHIELAQKFPDKCVQAYEEQMEAKKKELADKLPDLLSIIEEDAKAPKVDVDELKCMEVLLINMSRSFCILILGVPKKIVFWHFQYYQNYLG